MTQRAEIGNKLHKDRQGTIDFSFAMQQPVRYSPLTAIVAKKRLKMISLAP